MNAVRNFDVVVVGGGPAGCSAAGHLARSGFSVLVIDRTTFPRDKACSDGITARAAEHLRRMDPDLLNLGYPVRGVRVFYKRKGQDPGVREFGFDDASIRLIPRTILDLKLKEWATRQGAESWEHTTCEAVTAEPNGGFLVRVRPGHSSTRVDIRARLVVGADGATSVVRRAIGLKNDGQFCPGYGVRMYVENIEGLNSFVEIYLLAALWEELTAIGSAWVFPVGPGRANVGVAVYKTRQAEPAPNLKHLLRNFFEWLKRTDPRFSVVSRQVCKRRFPSRTGSFASSGVENQGCLSL